MSTSSAALADALVAWLARAGVTEVVVAPGSRNAPLAMALWAAAQHDGGPRLHTRIDERTAGFLALGLTRSGARAAVLTTSGTAVANLHPAVLEAVHSGVGLVVVSADRPARLRGTGANQTTDQVGIFGPLAATHDVATAAELDAVAAGWDDVVHLNVQLDTPLVPDAPVVPDEMVVFGGGSRPKRPVRRETDLPRGPRTVVVAGDDAGPPARQLAEAAGWPLLAEPTSGARTGANPIRTYRLLLGTGLGERIERVVVLGRPTLSRPVTRLLERPDVEVLVVPGRGAWPLRPPGAIAVDGPFWAGDEPDDPAWLDAWRAADRELSLRLDRLLAAEPALTPYDVAGATHAALPAGGLLVVGASSPVRDLDLMVRPPAVGTRRKVIANRGLAGIDGTVSTAIGAALGRDGSTRNLALMGDLTFLHDQTALVLGPDEPRPDLTIVVPNDDGGAIFSVLEQGAPAHAASFERLFGTPHGTDLASLCAAARIPHLRVSSRPELDQALAMPNGGIEVVEAVVSRTGRRDLDARIRGLAADLPGTD
ncbi:2-succinyl-5-enolpyruvyl-6-hydroxy-3-cyclohexene-1-carboxylic-acid synthase [Pimelobacter simplex]|uniref:2-succinyl-5-enolpyruvyl-6-hydroxy-3-cyclohexene-1-carboxylate synthase n=2 Tax=Nocardioides simplex TaxID=2045 RepID=A0A0A1DL53_NOCSI|nr:2-succinyl-5-enolpyruvyl-6-hydroxy-3-cyclohexene-1-carboxylic-acid synthase [Pimelobacter simplex]AIY16095.1 2-succinyl-5-enolpyruvyl-6-hydroxy-3- cyclohexene-1-carboxylic-acid synthase [Pimelobacter simplex]GEB12244.1 2-succinyl-5-enolpyruvyl-6-hydroxy-3-cyclohexene- 1-carboxylate synthase [Pimelobacter simplex]SFM97775.1 2-succinyl-5-enolpyruvyl-6-hydroxy-3-cyclohexene-1-carboxylate synthase [Pimelobacter simplex]